jgi:hypothetical protein
MLSGSTALVAVRRRDGPSLSKVSPGLREDSRPATPILQMLFAELASLKQQVNAMVVTGPSSLQPADHPSQRTTSSERVNPSRLRDVFD